MSLKTTKTEARDALDWFRASCPMPSEENRAHRQKLEAAARAEEETDPDYCLKTAEWLERIAAEKIAAGGRYEPAASNENLAEAARLRAIAAALTAPFTYAEAA